MPERSPSALPGGSWNSFREKETTTDRRKPEEMASPQRSRPLFSKQSLLASSSASQNSLFTDDQVCKGPKCSCPVWSQVEQEKRGMQAPIGPPCGLLMAQGESWCVTQRCLDYVVFVIDFGPISNNNNGNGERSRVPAQARHCRALHAFSRWTLSGIWWDRNFPHFMDERRKANT